MSGDRSLSAVIVDYNAGPILGAAAASLLTEGIDELVVVENGTAAVVCPETAMVAV